jgi:hypothetical protein
MPQIAPYPMNDVAAQNLANQAAWGMRPGDPTWISSKADADAFHAQVDAMNAASQARDAAANGGLGEAWISNPGGNPANYSNYKPPAAGTPLNLANPAAWQSQLTNPQMRTPSAAAPASGLNFANGTNVAPGSAIPPPSSATGYGFDPMKYLDPSMQFTMGEGLRALGSSAAAGGQVNSGQTLRDILKYSQGLASTNYNNAAQTAGQQQQFGYNVDNNDRNFAYQAAINDQTIPFDQQLKLAGLGLQGAQGQSNLSSVLATLLSGNTIAGGQAAGAGTIGANNSITSAISQILAQLTGNNLMNRIGV